MVVMEGQGRRQEIARKKKELLLEYLREHPETIAADLKGSLSTTLNRHYGNNIRNARREAGIPEAGTKPLLSKQQKRQQLIEWVRRNPDKASHELRRANRVGAIRMGELRAEAGIIPQGYVSAADKARQMGVSREWIRYLINKGRLKYVRRGRFIFVPEDVVPTKPRGKPGRPRKTY